MADNKKVMIGKYTRREFREAMDSGQLHTAIVVTGAIEQHLEHLAMEHDIAMATHIATEVATRLHPHVIVTVPMSFGLSEHHMKHRGSQTAKPGSWLSVIFDAVDGLARHGFKNILILNGHGGNEAPMDGILWQWQDYYKTTAPGVNIQFQSYWNLAREISEQHCTGAVPGHAQEYETSTAMYVFPENVRLEEMHHQDDKEPLNATMEKGRILVEAAISKTSEYLQQMIDGQHREFARQVFSRERYLSKQKKSV